MINHANLDGLLINQSLFQGISPFELEGLKRHVVKIDLEKGLSLFQKGDSADACYILVYGLLKLAIPTTSGSHKVIELIRPGQCFGEAMIFLEEPYPFYAKTLESSLLIKIPKQALFRLLEQSSQIAQQMMKGLSFRLLGFIRNLERQSSHNAMHRVIDYLLESAENQETTDIRLELKKNVVASILHLTPETFSRMLQQLMEEGLITVRASRINITSISALQDFLRFYNEQEMSCGKPNRTFYRDSPISPSAH